MTSISRHVDLAISPASGFDDLPAVSLDDALASCKSGGAILVANHRLARHLGEAYDRRLAAGGAPCWETPSIVPLARWLEERHDEALASGRSARVRLSPLVAERDWQRLVEADDAPVLLSPSLAARGARRAWALAHAWRCAPLAEEMLSPDQRRWVGWADAYATALREMPAVDEATLPDHAVELVLNGATNLPDAIALAGFLSPTPQESDLFATLVTAGARVSRVADTAPATPYALCWTDDDAELHGVADAVFRHVAAHPDSLVGVVVPDLGARRDDVLRAFDRRFFPLLTPLEIDAIGRPYDLAPGGPFAHLPVVKAALLALTLTFEELEADAASVLLLCPFITGAHRERRARERIDRKMRERRVQDTTLGAFVYRLGSRSTLHAPLRAFAKGRSGPAGRRHATLGDWAARFSAALHVFGWPGSALHEEERRVIVGDEPQVPPPDGRGPVPHEQEGRVIDAWHSLLDKLALLDDGETVRASAALSLLRALALDQLFESPSPDGPIRVLGRHESHGSHFDALWVTGLDEERWPSRRVADPFLPIESQRTAGVPSAGRSTEKRPAASCSIGRTRSPR